MNNNITIVGGGFVGMAYAHLLSEKNEVTVVDKSQEKVDAILSQCCAGRDGCDGSVRATTDGKATYAGADYVIIAVPTDTDPKTDELDCSAVEDVIEDVLNAADHALIVIKSTVPIGFTQSCVQKYDTDRIIYNPEFLREISALEDCRNPERIVVGVPSCVGQHDEDCDTAPIVEAYAQMLTESVTDPSVPVLYMTSSEAEAVKLFSNTYLAMRVAFFNELDSFAEGMDLDTATIIRGVCSDSRIGDHYNEPSFGYGGTCLPKDVEQLHSQVKDAHGDLIGAIGESNRSRQSYIADRIVSLLASKFSSQDTKRGEQDNGSPEPDSRAVAGIYRLGMQSGSNNFRQSSVLEILKLLLERGVTVVIYEPALGDERQFLGCEVVEDLDTFKRTSDLIITNRYDMPLDDVRAKVYTRDKKFREE